ncbi:MAG: 50S ribosomal protein L25 [Planctomycetota bacterium]
MEAGMIQAETRKPEGKHGNERLRRRGLLPAIVYGHKEAPEMIALSRHDTELALAHKQHLVKVMLEGREQQYLIKDVQYDHLQKTPVHVDLMRVDVRERVQVSVPLEFRGTAKGTLAGGTLVTVLAELEVECTVLEIPEFLRVRVDHLDINDALRVREVELPPNVKVLHNADDIVIVVHAPRVLEEAPAAGAVEAAEGAAEPEVIARGKEEQAEKAGE